MSNPKFETSGSYDPRSAANLLLNEADRIGIPVTNLSLQKLLYFAHGISLVEYGKPLVSGYFEAWQHGPVHPVIYDSFKRAGAAEISFRATGFDLLTGADRDLAEIEDRQDRYCVVKVLVGFGRLAHGVLVDISHARNAPWHYIVEKARSSVVLGMRIPDNVIQERFRYHVTPIRDGAHIERLIEDEPLVGNRTCQEWPSAAGSATQESQEA